MAYVKALLTPVDIAQLRVNLSTQPMKLSDEPVCDFCGSTRPEWRYAATRMSTGEARECWRWLACDQCGTAIEMGMWLVVESRVRGKLREMVKVMGDGAELFTEAILTKSVRAALDQFHEYAKRLETGAGDDNGN